MPAPASLIKRQLNECWDHNPHPAPQLSEGAEAWLEDRVHSGCALLHKKGKGLQVDQHRKWQEAHLSLKPCQLAHPHIPYNSQAPSGPAGHRGFPGSVTPGNSQQGSCGWPEPGEQYLQTRLWGWGSYSHKLQYSSSSFSEEQMWEKSNLISQDFLVAQW